MNAFTVEVVTRPVENDDWGSVRSVTDHLPGTILIEDAGEPMLIIPIDAPNLKSAAIFVQGAMSVLGHEVVWGRAYLTEPENLADTDIRKPTPGETDLVPSWLEDEAATADARRLLFA